jgi:hypothetical protein
MSFEYEDLNTIKEAEKILSTDDGNGGLTAMSFEYEELNKTKEE